MDSMRLRETLAFTGALRAQGGRRISLVERVQSRFRPATTVLAPLTLGDALEFFVATLAMPTERTPAEISGFLKAATTQIIDPRHMPLVLSHVGVLAQWQDVHPAKLEAPVLPAVCHLKSGGFVVVVHARPGGFRVFTSMGVKSLARPAFTAQVECKVMTQARVR